MITSLSQLDFSKKYTYADYILWQFQERVELLKGYLFPMAAPSILHQQISGNLYYELKSFFKGKGCQVLHAPTDVRLPLQRKKVKKDKIDTVVQPDLFVVCDMEKLEKQSCVGAPDLVVEILSLGNSKKEMIDKFELYEEAGVLEYWIIDPERIALIRYALNSKTNKFESVLPNLSDENVLVSKVFPDLKIDLSEVFPK